MKRHLKKPLKSLYPQKDKNPGLYSHFSLLFQNKPLQASELWHIYLQIHLLLSYPTGGSEKHTHPLPMPCLGPLGMSYKVICRCLPFVLGLEVTGRG